MEVERALALLTQRPLGDESVHTVRQALKRARAALRLLRDAVGKRACARENAALRDAARTLAPARDACVALQLVDELLAARELREHRQVLLGFRSQLRLRHARALAAVRAQGATRKSRGLLKQCLERTARWRVPHDAAPVYQRGLRRTYRKGRRELEAALASGSARARHECRKHAKYLEAALRLAATGERAAKAGEAAAKVARHLGDEHDLSVLVATLRHMRAHRMLLAAVEQRRRKLQRRGIRLARRLYEPSPARFVSRVTKIKPAASGL